MEAHRAPYPNPLVRELKRTVEETVSLPCRSLFSAGGEGRGRVIFLATRNPYHAQHNYTRWIVLKSVLVDLSAGFFGAAVPVGTAEMIVA